MYASNKTKNGSLNIVFIDLEKNIENIKKFQDIIEPIQIKYKKILEDFEVQRAYFLNGFISACKKMKKEKFIKNILTQADIEFTELTDTDFKNNKLHFNIDTKDQKFGKIKFYKVIRSS